MDKKRLTVLMTLFCVVLLCACVFVYVGEDRTEPEIVFPEGSISYKQGDDTSVLLQGVTATDERDGDVSDSVKIDGITEIPSMNYVVVTYVAKDESNNIVKKERWIDLNDGTTSSEPMVNLEEELKEESDELMLELQTETEEPVTEKPTAGKPDEVSTETEAESTIADTTEMETEMDESEESSDNEAEELISTGAPIIRITSHDITLRIGERFDYMNYVKTCVDDQDTMDQLYSRIIVNGEDQNGNYVGAGTIDTSRANTYKLQFYVVDTDGNASNIEEMQVRIGE